MCTGRQNATSDYHVSSQGFIALRVYWLSKRLWYLLFSLTLCFLQLAGSVAVFVTTFRTHTISEFTEKYLWLMSATMGTVAVIDICNTVALCYGLREAKIETAGKR